MDINKIEYELYKLIKKAARKKEVPVAAIIVYKNKIISKAYNLVEKKNSVLCHAEILAIKKATKKLKNWRLNDCTLYVTLEPCKMCKNIIEKSRIKKVIYFTNQEIKKEKVISFYSKYVESDIFSNYLKSFFKNRR